MNTRTLNTAYHAPAYKNGLNTVYDWGGGGGGLNTLTYGAIIMNLPLIYIFKCNNTKLFRFFVSFLLNVTVNNFSVMSGRSHRFLGITSTFGELMRLAQGHNTATRVRIELQPLDPEIETLTTRPPRPPNNTN